jgi:hypothetical protein
MNVTVNKVDGKTQIRIYNEAPGLFTEQQFQVYAPDGSKITSPNKSGGLASLTWTFYIEEYPSKFLEPYPESTRGSFSVAIEKINTAGIGIKDWTEMDRWSGEFDIYSNSVTAPSIDTITITPSEAVLEQQIYVKTKNGVKVTEVKADAKYKASIAKTEWYIGDGSTRYKVGESSDKLLTYGAKIPVVAEVTDTRGFKTTKSFEIEVYDYFSPQVVPINGAKDIKAERSGTAISFAVGRKYASVGGFNKCTLSYKLKAISDTEWGEATTTLLGTKENTPNEFTGTINENLNDQTIYYVEITASDLLRGAESIIVAIPTDEVFMHKSASLGSLGIGSYATLKKAFEVFLDTHLYNVSQLILTSPGGTKYAVVVDDNGNLSATNADITSLTGEE